jgi:cobalt-zinc-cadmium efflux system outer membrane protein
MMTLMLSVALWAAPPGAPFLRLSVRPSADELALLLWRQAPSLQTWRSRLAAAEADAQRAHLLPNPDLDLAAGTLPVGSTNPPGLSDPWLNVPNVQVGVSEVFELGKRGPRQEATGHLAEAARRGAQAEWRERFYDLMGLIGEIAASQARIDDLGELLEDARELAALQAARASHGDVAALDLDRAVLEEHKLRSGIAVEKASLLRQLQDCSALLAMDCQPFDGADEATAYLEAPPPDGAAQVPLDRPDLQALLAYEEGARANARLSSGRRYPDLTVRLAYTRDQFVVSGNQRNSLSVGLSVPLPLFEQGDEEARAYVEAASAAKAQREGTLRAAQAQLARLRDEWEAMTAHRSQLQQQALPLARDIVARLGAAVERGAATLPELLLARRSLEDLTMDAHSVNLLAYRLRVAMDRESGATPDVISHHSLLQEAP